MKAVSINQPGGPEELTMTYRDKPIAKTGEVLVKIKASAVNRTDVMKRQNTSLKKPYPILGVEMAGVIEENHSNNHKLKVGTRVAGLVNEGSYAEYAVLPADRTITLPENISYAKGAAIPEVFLTAYQTLYWLGKLEKGQTVLIHAGASGVGTAAIQMAKKMTEAQVIVTAGSHEKLQYCKQLGADKTINYKEEDFSKQVLEWTNEAGADVILDFIGASYWKKNLNSIKIDGRWVLIGVLGGSKVTEVDLSKLLAKRVTIAATLLTPRSDAYKASLTQEFIKNVLPFFEDGRIKPIIDTTFPLEDVAKAHQYMEDNKNIGKLILEVNKGE